MSLSFLVFLAFIAISVLEEFAAERLGTGYLRLCPMVARRTIMRFGVPSMKLVLPSTVLIPIVAVPIKVNALLLRESFFLAPRIGYPIFGYGLVERTEGSAHTLTLRIGLSAMFAATVIGVLPMDLEVRLSLFGIMASAMVVQWVRFSGAIDALAHGMD